MCSRLFLFILAQRPLLGDGAPLPSRRRRGLRHLPRQLQLSPNHSRSHRPVADAIGALASAVAVLAKPFAFASTGRAGARGNSRRTVPSKKLDWRRLDRSNRAPDELRPKLTLRRRRCSWWRPQNSPGPRPRPRGRPRDRRRQRPPRRTPLGRRLDRPRPPARPRDRCRQRSPARHRQRRRRPCRRRP